MGCLRVPSIAHPPGSPDILNKQDLPRHEARQRRLWVLLSVNTATSACALSWLDMKTEKGFYIAVHKSGDTLLAHASKHYLNSQLRSAGANRDWDFENVPTTPLDNDSNAALLYAIELFRLRILESTDFYQSPSGCPDWRQALYLNHRETAQNVEEWGAEMAMTSLHCQAFSYELGHSNYTRYPDRPLRRSASLQEYKAVQVEAGRVLNITYKPNVTFFVGGVADLPELSIEGDLDRMRRDISAFALEDFRASRAPSLVPSRQQSRESTAPAGPILRSSRGRSISSELSRLPSGTPTDPYSSSPRGTPVGPGPTINLSMQQTARPGRATEAPLHQRLRSSNIMPPSFPDRPQEPRVPLWNELHSLNPIRPSVGSPNWTGFDHAIKMDMYEADCERIRRVRMQNQERTAAAAAARAEFESRRGQRRGQR
ncbi:hypothetical protein M406DRAFT_102695 [Cryphonectria parasitica EP155]|uniref:Uncharacterized protein n=1 Tax=Cryphonectria parasitica (strain ATCC 38755 / EP155) TaxID=660469 RepID=A0A9P5CRK1_CRYP1|nr:uncharacterized protein M406DRAFT_103640 [Cryphonectria parasitica EP155]XP_040779294.1 uncharacterized protein M406DRAFT_102695 [Cryphonectria parasitica EP155]KAF3763713.1 hypothetical protein M406DRAFT_103640 [Cryphonectria parasitica EP155]KAF3768333.1 hypothetical protein M406DRAFT_102695 [Cryphonectria parasitica EP155]